MTFRFALVTQDEIWSIGERPSRPQSPGVPPGDDRSQARRPPAAGETPALLERRLIHGFAIQRGLEIQATDACDDEVLERCDQEMNRVRVPLETLLEGRARVVASARRVGDRIRVNAWINATIGSLSMLSAPQHFARDAELLVELASIAPAAAVDYRGIPIVWRNGSASVLLHEAVGHAAEHHQEPIEWPGWLSVSDEPEFDFDDAGEPTRKADLIRGEPPRSMLRESFSDVPLPRMSRVIVRHEGQSFEPPKRRIEIQLLAGGTYEPLSETVVLMISAADLLDDERSVRLKPFTIRETRRSIARAIRSAAGDPIRYPGLVCSREGQEMVVASHAPLMLTVF